MQWKNIGTINSYGKMMSVLIRTMPDEPSEMNSPIKSLPTKKVDSSSSSSELKQNNNTQSVKSIHPLYISEINSPKIISECNSPIDNNNCSFEQLVVDRFFARLEIKVGELDTRRFFDAIDDFLPIFHNKLFLQCLFELIQKHRSITCPMAKRLLHRNGITKDKNTIRKYLDYFTETLSLCDKIKSNETDLNLPTLKPVDFIIYTIDYNFGSLKKHYGEKTEQKTDRFIRALESKKRKKDLAKKAQEKRELETKLAAIKARMGDITLDRYLKRDLAEEHDEVKEKLEELND